MTGKPQTLTKGQEEAVVQILRSRLFQWILIGLAILTGLTGMSLWGIMTSAKREMRDMVSKQFEEPRIQEITIQAARERASLLMEEQIKPAVTEFESELAKQRQEFELLVKAEASALRKEAESLRTSMAWRRVSLAQYQIMVSSLKGKLKEEVWVEFVGTDPEATLFRGDIWKTLTDAGVKLKYFSGLTMGVGLQITNTETGEGKLVGSAFEAAEIPFEKRSKPVQPSAAHNVEIIIGSKPPPSFAPSRDSK